MVNSPGGSNFAETKPNLSIISSLSQIMSINCNRLLLASLFLACSAMPSLAQRCKITYYCRSTSAAYEAYVPESVDVQPEFPGGDNAMMKFINRERQYPREAYKAGIGGRVLCSFIVMPDGSISNIEVVRGVEQSIDREAVRIISSMPAWKAGKIGNSPVPVYYLLPIAFRL